MDHGGGILAMVMGSGLVVQSVLLILIALSVWSWAITIAKTLHFRRARAESKEFNDIFWESRNLTRIDDSARRLNASPLVQVFSSGYREFGHVLQDKSGVGQSESLPTVERALARAEFEEAVKLERGITFLATTASAAPFIGLFGTVWGIMNSFRGLSSAHQATLAMVAPGISEALVATAMGLFAAIPAVIFYTRFSSEIDRLSSRYEIFLEEFSAILQRQVHV
jgi:biopolymer transport protein TolQ